jgi:hypothetical protein
MPTLLPNWETSDEYCKELLLGDGMIDESPSMMQLVSANIQIGGNMFEKTLSYEETILLLRPETLLTTLICKALGDEVIVVIGAEKMSHRKGYGSNLEYDGDIMEARQRVIKNGVNISPVAVVFADASNRTAGKSQFIQCFDRDLNKIYVAFSSMESPDVAGGNWTYGFLGNNIQLKFFQQLLASALARKRLIYHSITDDLENQIVQFSKWTANFSVKELYMLYKVTIQEVLEVYGETKLNTIDLFDCMMNGAK